MSLHEFPMKRLLSLLTFGDKLLIALLVLCSVASFFFLVGTSSVGVSVQIQSGSGESFIYPLDQDRELFITGPLGQTEVVIRNRRVRITSSPCPNKLCIHMGAIRRSGEMIVCVPNRISVRVVGEEKYGVDATTM
jgi:hypothetical protein